MYFICLALIYSISHTFKAFTVAWKSEYEFNCIVDKITKQVSSFSNAIVYLFFTFQDHFCSMTINQLVFGWFLVEVWGQFSGNSHTGVQSEEP